MVFILSYDLRNYASIDLGLSNKCYAFTRGKRYKNSLSEETFSLSLDQAFEFEGRTIEAGSDLFQIPEIKSHISMFVANYVFDYGGADKVIAFDNAFLPQLNFQENRIKQLSNAKPRMESNLLKPKRFRF